MVITLAVTAPLRSLCKTLPARTPSSTSSAKMTLIKLSMVASTIPSLSALLEATLLLLTGLIHVQSKIKPLLLQVSLTPAPPTARSTLLTSALMTPRKSVMADGHSNSELELKPILHAATSQLISISFRINLPILVMSLFLVTRSLTHSTAIASRLSLLRLTSMALVRSMVNSTCATQLTKSFRSQTPALGLMTPATLPVVPLLHSHEVLKSD